MERQPSGGDEIMKLRATQNQQSQYLGVLRYKDPKPGSGRSSNEPLSAVILPRWLDGTREERITRILNDLPEACFRAPSTLCDTLRAIYREIYRQHPELWEPIEEMPWDQGREYHGNRRAFPTGEQVGEIDEESDQVGGGENEDSQV
jgi:hypothetical protein